jgi:hypothetical protein
MTDEETGFLDLTDQLSICFLSLLRVNSFHASKKFESPRLQLSNARLDIESVGNS